MSTSSLVKGSVIKSEDLKVQFVEEIVKAGGEKIRLCFQCGTCTGSCPSGRRTAFKTRQLIGKSLLGLRDEVLSDKNLWTCTSCYTCMERCPRGIDVTNLIFIIRNIAARSGFMLDKHKVALGYLIKTGHLVPITENYSKLRGELGLEAVPPTTHKHSEALKEFQQLISSLQFDKLAEQENKK